MAFLDRLGVLVVVTALLLLGGGSTANTDDDSWAQYARDLGLPIKLLNISGPSSGLHFTVLSGGDGPHRPTVLALHGFPDNAYSFHAQVPAFIDAGMRVIAPVLRGYEASTTGLPTSNYSLDRIVQDLVDITDQLVPPHEKIHLFGHDWGAMLAYMYAASHPDRVASAITLAVPYNFSLSTFVKHPIQVYNSWYMLWFQIPRLAELWFTTKWYGLNKLWRDWSPGYEPPQPFVESLKATFGQPGVVRSAMSYYRCVVPALLLAGKVPSPAIPLPTLVLHGDVDGCIDPRLFQPHDTSHPLFLKGYRRVTVEGAGHFLHQEKPQVVNKLALDWILHHQPPREEGDGQQQTCREDGTCEA